MDAPRDYEALGNFGLDALRGVGSRPKVERLRNLAWIDDVDIRLHYLLQTDLGLYAAKSLIKELGLKRLKVEEDPRTMMMPVLSSGAGDRFESGEYKFVDVERHLLRPEDVVPCVEGQRADWLDDALRSRVCSFLRSIGAFYTSADDGRKVADVQSVSCELPFGANNIGSLCVFSHSAPRAAIPVYWRDGLIGLACGNQVRWTALVPEEHYLEDDAAL